jgi:hypothetical protein
MKSFDQFTDSTNIIFMVDHAGRAGNAFFQTIFDTHPQVISCPWMPYVYSYIIDEFDCDGIIDSSRALLFWSNSRYFSLLYSDLNDENIAFIKKMGGDPRSQVNRPLLRREFSNILLRKRVISRKDLILAVYYSFAMSINKDLDDIKYILCPDSISLKSETAITGFTGKIIDLVVSDFPEAKLIHLERDPRAGFASSTHQFINQYGNMYGLKRNNLFTILNNNLRCNHHWDSSFVFLFWLIYFKQTYRSICNKKNDYLHLFSTVKNEDLNLNFTNTMRDLSVSLDIAFISDWHDAFVPTMIGLPWKGTGAYNSNYQTATSGPLQNDPPHISSRVTGPNKYVTERWKSRLKRNEIRILEYIFREELLSFSYPLLTPAAKSSLSPKLLLAILLPFSGEFPSFEWIYAGFRISPKELSNRIFYILALPLLYLSGRLSFLKILIQSNILK